MRLSTKQKQENWGKETPENVFRREHQNFDNYKFKLFPEAEVSNCAHCLDSLLGAPS